MRILITSSKGQLGIDLINRFSSEHEVLGICKDELDISNLDLILAYFEQYAFDVVINAAAYTKVDQCETDFDNAFKANAIGPRNLAIASDKYGFKLIHISTDYVFDGDNPNGYYEYDKTNPINKYGLSKLYGEDYIRNHCTKFFIIRTSWLYGRNGNNFVKTMLKLSETRDEIKVIDDQIGSPTFTEDLVDFIFVVMRTEKYGIYHFSNSGTCSWNEFAKEIFKLTGKKIKVLPISTEEYNSPAKRPKYSIMKNYMAEIEFGYRARDWTEALREYLGVYS